MTDKADIPPSYSLYLDVLRFVAAVAVYLNHITMDPFIAEGAPVSALGLYGAAAVTVFFVLSGYVIAYVVATRENNLRSYTISRLSRLYSVVAPAIALTLLLDYWGSAIDPALYATRVVSPEPMTPLGYVSSFFLINEFQIFGFHGVGPGSNGPWWSLSFEAAYYLLAAVLLFMRPGLAIVLTLVLVAVFGRTIVAMAPLWGLGFLLFANRKVLARKLPLASVWWVLSVFAILLIPYWLPNTPDMNFGLQFPWARAELNRNLAQDYAVAVAVAVHLVASYKMLAGTSTAAPGTMAIIRFLGAMTFPLYAMHRPLTFFLAAINPWENASAYGIAFVTLSIAVFAALATPLCDGLKRLLREQLGRAWPKVARDSAAVMP